MEERECLRCRRPEELALDFRKQRAPTVNFGSSNEVGQLPGLSLLIAHQIADLHPSVRRLHATHDDLAARFMLEASHGNGPPTVWRLHPAPVRFE